jgi:two-component system response regulator NreC
MPRIRVLLVDDHAIVRAGIRSLLSLQPDIQVVGEASSGEEALELAERLRPDVVLMDLRLKGMSGLEAIRELKKRLPKINTLALTMVDNPQYFFPVLEAGACGYLLKEAEPEELLTAVRAAARNEAFLSPAVARAVVGGYLAGKGVVEDSYISLTDREREVLRLVAQGYTSRQIAEMLHLSRKTVEKYRASAMEKLGLRSRAELVSYALSRGLLGVPDIEAEPKDK